MACSSKFRWSAPPSRAVSSCYSYSLPSPATPPQIAKYHASIAAAAHTRLRIQLKAALHSENEVDEEEEDFQVLSAVQSNYNRIVILDTPKSRLLLLDSCRQSNFIPPFRLNSFLLLYILLISRTLQIMSIACLTKTVYGLVPIGYVIYVFVLCIFFLLQYYA